MRRFAHIMLGASLFMGGTAKAMHHLGAVDPMAAYWCRNGTLSAPEPTHWLFEPHCWGCGAALVGALLMAYGARKTRAFRVPGASERPVRLSPV
ncbi:MAG: hypothetical protein AAF829_07620 [Pseudomonadota bacterium]